jgi:hypothetical protein
MSKELSTITQNEAQPPVSLGDDVHALWQRVVGRRSFLKGVGIAGAAALPGSAMFTSQAVAQSTGITSGDIDILRFLAAAELIEADLWTQYNELGGVKGGNHAYTAALENLDEDLPQYISDNTDDENSHVAFLNAYLQSRGASPVNLDAFRTLPSSKAKGAKQIGRLTNLQALDVDTSWYLRYRSTQNPDLGATFPQAVTIRNQPAIPLTDADTPPNLKAPVPPHGRRENRMQAIANTAGFHFTSSSRAAPASTARWHSRSRALRCCRSWSASAASRSTTSRSGTTRRATPWPSPWPVWSTPRRTCGSPTSTPTAARRRRRT